MGMLLDSAIYFVMRHYSLSLRDVDELSSDEFNQMFSWAAAVAEYEAEKMKEQSDKTNSSSAVKVGSTDMGKPMPHSEGW